jgi:FkbM family methyltransferase
MNVRTAVDRLLPSTWQDRLRPAYRRYQRLVGPFNTRRDLEDMRHLDMLLPWVLRRDSNCIDVGAHTGEVLRRCLDLAPEGDHIAFEPLPALASRLSAAFPSVTVIQAVVYDVVVPSTPFHHFTAHPALSGMTNRPPGPTEPVEVIDVPQTTIDASVPDGYRVDLLKIDVEGAELGVLRGARATVERSDPTVVIEFGRHAAEHYGGGPRQLLELLTELGLRLFDIDGNGPYTLDQLTRRWEDNSLWNFVAHR